MQTLQRRLIHKTEEIAEKDSIVSEKDKLYAELKNLLARQPGPEVAEQLSIYQQNLKEKTHALKSMAAELNMFQAQAGEYKYEIERLNNELSELKKQYYEVKRRDSLSREIGRKSLRLRDNLLTTRNADKSHNMTLPDIPIGLPRSTRHSRQHSARLTGGGFPLMMR